MANDTVDTDQRINTRYILLSLVFLYIEEVWLEVTGGLVYQDHVKFGLFAWRAYFFPCGKTELQQVLPILFLSRVDHEPSAPAEPLLPPGPEMVSTGV